MPATLAYWPMFAWGLLLLASFIGWGWATALLLRIPDRRTLDWGLLAGWGAAFSIALGGALALFSLATRPVLCAIVLAGALVALARLLRTWRGVRPAPVIGLALVIVLWYAPSVALRQFNPCDDYIAYLTFVRRLLDSGTLLEPFSLRRLATYGGQAFLQAEAVSIGSLKNVNLLEIGLGPVLIAGLTWGWLRISKSVRFALAATALVVLVQHPEANIMSQTIGIVLFLALFRTFDESVRLAPGARAAIGGMLTAALCALRSCYIPPALLILSVSVALLMFRRAGGWRAHAKAAAAGMASALVCLAPWMLLLWRSSRSLIYPLMRGVQQPGFPAFSPNMGLPARIAAAVPLASQPLIALPMAAMLFLILARKTAQGILWYSATAMTLAAMTMSFPWADRPSVYRYVEPLLFVTCLAVSPGFLAIRDVRARWRSLLALAGAPLLAPALLILLCASVARHGERLEGLPGQIADRGDLAPASEIASYRMVQASAPPSATLLAVVDNPALFSYRKAAIVNADIPGACAYPPGMPLFRGPATLRQYLLRTGVRYVAWTDFDKDADGSELYVRGVWLRHLGGDEPIWKAQAPWYLAMMANIEALAKSETRIRDAGRLHLIELRTP